MAIRVSLALRGDRYAKTVYSVATSARVGGTDVGGHVVIAFLHFHYTLRPASMQIAHGQLHAGGK